MVRPSPGIYTSELEFTETRVEISRTRPMIVGGATKGPKDTPTVIGSELELTQVFGNPVEADLGLLTAVEYLKSGNQMVYLRVANGDVAASLNLLGKPVSTAGVKATGSMTLIGLPTDADNVVLQDGLGQSRTFEFDQSVAATGSLEFTGQPVDGETSIINDGYIARTFEFDSVAFATGSITITITLNVADGDTVTLRDAVGNTVIFEYESAGGVAVGNVAVAIGVDDDTSAANLASAINAQQLAGNLEITATSTINVIDVTQVNFGVAGNTVIDTVGANLVNADFTGGEDLAAGTPGNIAVQIGATNTATATNFVAAVEAQTGYKISAVLDVTGNPTAAFTNDEPGADGASAGSKNTAIIGVVTGVTNAGMSGGVEAGVTGANIAVTIGVDKDTSAQNLVSAINAVAAYDISAQLDTSGADPVVNVTQNTAGSAGNTTITESTAGARIVAAGFVGGVTEILGADVSVLTIAAFTTGSWANTMTVTLVPTTVMNAPVDNFDITVDAPVDNVGTLQTVERFLNLSMEPTLLGATNPRFVETVINEGVRGEVNPSRFITATQIQPYTPNAGVFILSTGTAGLDGITGLTAADFVGSTSGNSASGLKAAENKELTDFNLLATPGWADHRDVINAIISTCEFRGDCFGLIDPPLGLTVDEVIDWHNGDGFSIPNSPLLPIDSNSVAIYWPWVRVFSNYLQKQIWLPPSSSMLRVFAFTDENPGPWFAPAGYTRGVLNDVLKIEYSPLQAERDRLVGGNSRVNPFVENTDASGTTFVVLAQESATRTPGPLDAVHVKRMAIFAKTESAKSVRELFFDPNDPTTWRAVEQTISPILQNIQDQRGLEAGFFQNGRGYVVKCDADTNPPEQRAEGTLRAKILLKHVDAAEIIELDFGLIGTGAEFTT